MRKGGQRYTGHLLSLILFYFKMAFIYKKITNGGYSFYIHILKVPPTFLLQQFSAIVLYQWLFGLGDTVSPPPLQTALDTETFRNVQESGRCNIHIRLRYKNITIPFYIYTPSSLGLASERHQSSKL